MFFRLAFTAMALALPSLALAVDEAAAKRLDDAMQLLQPTEEREKQDNLPKSEHPVWAVLTTSKVAYSNTPPHITISLTAPVRALAGKIVSASGFVLPMDEGLNTAQTKHFLLSQRTPTCTFCPPGEPNEVIEVVLPKAIEWTAKEVKVEGVFKLVNNTNNGIFYRIDVAK